MSSPVRTEAGHQVLTQAHDVTIGAWAPSRTGCLEELVRGVAESFGDIGTASPTRTMPFRVNATTDTEVMLAILDDLYFLLDSAGLLVAGVSLHEDGKGNLNGSYSLVPIDDLVESISVHKGSVRSNAKFAPDGTGWRARVVIDS